MTHRKPVTKDADTACLDGFPLNRRDRRRQRHRCQLLALRVELGQHGGRHRRLAARSSSAWLNARCMTMPSRAIASRPAARDTALLMPDARPAWTGSSAFMTVVVRGATVTVMPKPSRTTAGKKLVQ
jgi:hypothetical protein